LAIRLQSVFQLNRGDTIAVCLPNSIEFPTVTLAGNEAGVVVTTVNPIYTSGEWANFNLVFLPLESLQRLLAIFQTNFVSHTRIDKIKRVKIFRFIPTKSQLSDYLL
jgi:acyl-CoA synthetase (AMP-forming)/AMP-acid ligase II